MWRRRPLAASGGHSPPARPGSRVLGTGRDNPACKGRVAGRQRPGQCRRHTQSEGPWDVRSDAGPPSLSCRRDNPASLDLPPALPISNSPADSTCLCFSVLTDCLVGEARVRRGLVACPQSTFLLMPCCVAFSLRLDLNRDSLPSSISFFCPFGLVD